MNLHMLKPRFHLLVGLLITLVAISPAQNSDIVCPGSWKQVSNSGPPAGYFFSLAFEPRGPHGHVMLFEGDDTWTWDGAVWIHAADTGPSGRSEPGMAYDIAQRQMVLFGGDDINQDTSAWDGTKWTEVATGGPPARSGHGMAYDGARQRTVLFGGCCGDQFLFLGDTWEWDGKAWSQRSPASSPNPRGHFGMVYDGWHSRTVLFGGAGGGGALDFADTWTWDGTVWTKVADSAETETGPIMRRWVGMTYDGARHRTVLFGGTFGEADIVFGDTWEWDGVRWTQVATTGPAPRWALSLAYDKARGKSVLFGGFSNPPRVAATGVPGATGGLQDTWEWRGPIYGCSNRAAGDLNCDRVVNHQDLTIVDSALGLPACSAADPRDLNQDGKINAQDAQLLANKCTKLGCK